MQKEVDFTINPDGTIEIDMIGYKGKMCDTEMKKIAKQLGVVVKSKKKKEYFAETKVRLKEKQ